VPIPVTAPSKVWVCGRSLAGIVGLNPAGNMDVLFLCFVKYRSLRRADHSYRGVVPSAISECDREASIMRRP
jgi:hypothetical protein